MSFDLVTGGSGFIGCHLARLLVQSGRRVRVLDRAPFPADEPAQPHEVHLGDITDPRAVARAVDGAQRVFHLAGLPILWSRDPDIFDRVNRGGTETVLEQARLAGVERFVHTSTESILTPRDRHQGLRSAGRSCRVAITEDVLVTEADQLGPYCLSKFRAEQAVFRAAAQGFPAVVVNPTMPMGPGDRGPSPPGRMLRDFLSGGIGGYIDSVLNFVSVHDAALGHILAAEHGQPGRRYILAGHNLSILRLFELAGAMSGIRPPRMRVPLTLALGFAHAEEFWGRLTGRQPMSSVTGIRLCQRSMAFDGSRTWRELGGHTPRPLEESLREAVDWHLREMRKN